MIDSKAAGEIVEFAHLLPERWREARVMWESPDWLVLQKVGDDSPVLVARAAVVIRPVEPPELRRVWIALGKKGKAAFGFSEEDARRRLTDGSGEVNYTASDEVAEVHRLTWRVEREQ